MANVPKDFNMLSKSLEQQRQFEIKAEAIKRIHQKRTKLS